MPTVDNLGVAHVCAKRLWRHIEPIQFECSRNEVPHGRYWWRHGGPQSNSRLGTAWVSHFGVGLRHVSEGSFGQMSTLRKEERLTFVNIVL